MKLLVLNGPNLNLLGVREPELYGTASYAALCDFIRETAQEAGVSCDIFQSNHEGVLVDRIQEALGNYDAIVINPAAYTHTSVAIADALAAVAIPFAEVHLTDINAREPFRARSFVAPLAAARFMGEGFESYRRAIRFFAEK